MIGFEEKNGALHADNVSLSEIASKTGTPTYVYSAGAIRAQYEKLSAAMSKALPPSRQPLLCYACKANSHTAILKLLQKLGSGLEIVSEGELVRGLKAGFDPDKIVSTGVGKTESEITACLNVGIHQINVESLPELERIGKIAESLGKTARVVFRLNPDVSGGGHHKISTGRSHDKFGISAKQVMEGFARAKGLKGIEVLGLSMHIGSQVFTVESFKKAFEKLPVLVKELRANGHTVQRLDIGGGFPIIYKDEKLLDLDAYASWVNEIIVPLGTEIIMEPGRFLVGNAGALLTRVAYIKETEGNNFLILDAAMNDLIRPTLYEAWHGIEPVENRNAKPKVYDVVGPICESGDTFATDRSIPALQAGDLAVIRSAGAYGFSMASNYNTRPLPAEVLVDGDKYAVIRQRQNYEDILKSESIPDWLK
jgi:diaminopimelate decarboxylase